jgi:hypothetical protein
MLRTIIAATLIVAPAGYVVAQDAASSPQRIRNVTVEKGQPCPRSTSEEIVVCSTLEEPFRIPKGLREEPKTDVQSTAWASRVDGVMRDNRRQLPGSCSAIGTGGQTGCAQQAAENWIAERRAAENGQPVTPQ